MIDVSATYRAGAEEKPKISALDDKLYDTS
jgi:hypothetical protein